jgi:hypothetical protein
MRANFNVIESRNLYRTVTDPGSGLTLTPHPQAICSIVNMTSGGAESRTLGDPAFVGQFLILVAEDQGGGDITITHDDTFDGTNNTATFGDGDDSIVLLAAGTTADTWRSIANAGVSLSSVVMAEEEIVTVGPGGDYADFDSWQDAELKDLQATNKRHVLEVLDAVVYDGTVISASWNSDVDHALVIRAAAAAKHAGVYSEAEGIARIDTDGSVMPNNAPYLEMEDLIFTGNGASLVQANSGTEVVIRRCIAKTGDFRIGAAIMRLENSIVFDNPFAVLITVASASGMAFVHGCVLVNPDWNIFQNGGTLTEDGNYYAAGPSGDVFNGGGTYNKGAASASDNDEAVTVALQDVAYDTGTFVSVTAGSEDYRLAVGSPLLDVGPDFSALGITDDLVGVARPQGAASDIGALETSQ